MPERRLEDSLKPSGKTWFSVHLRRIWRRSSYPAKFTCESACVRGAAAVKKGREASGQWRKRGRESLVSFGPIKLITCPDTEEIRAEMFFWVRGYFICFYQLIAVIFSIKRMQKCQSSVLLGHHSLCFLLCESITPSHNTDVPGLLVIVDNSTQQ